MPTYVTSRRIAVPSRHALLTMVSTPAHRLTGVLVAGVYLQCGAEGD